MTESRQPTIVVGVDGSSSALRATRWAAREAERRHATLHLVHARPLPRVSRLDAIQAPDARNALLSTGYEMLADAERAALEISPDLKVTSELRIASAASVLITAAKTAELLVLGSRGLGGVSGLLIGSVAVAASAHADCPVVVVRGDDSSSGPVVVGVDATSRSDPAIAFAFDAAAARAVPLVALHVSNDDEVGEWPGPAREQAEHLQRRLLSERLAAWREKYPDVHLQVRVRRGLPAPVLIEQSELAQLVVVGTHGRGGLAGLAHGSVSHALLHHSHCPVAVIRPHDAAAE